MMIIGPVILLHLNQVSGLSVNVVQRPGGYFPNESMFPWPAPLSFDALNLQFVKGRHWFRQWIVVEFLSMGL